MKTLSGAGCLKPSSRILSMRPDSPGPGAFGSMNFVPIATPRKTATTTNASQPNVAVFQWSALPPRRHVIAAQRVPPSFIVDAPYAKG